MLGDGAEGYTLSFGPQIGPHFAQARRAPMSSANTTCSMATTVSEDGVIEPRDEDHRSLDQVGRHPGKYFTVAGGIPDSTAYKTVFSNKAPASDLALPEPDVSRLAFVQARAQELDHGGYLLFLHRTEGRNRSKEVRRGGRGQHLRPLKA